MIKIIEIYLRDATTDHPSIKCHNIARWLLQMFSLTDGHETQIYSFYHNLKQRKMKRLDEIELCGSVMERLRYVLHPFRPELLENMRFHPAVIWCQTDGRMNERGEESRRKQRCLASAGCNQQGCLQTDRRNDLYLPDKIQCGKWNKVWSSLATYPVVA